MIEAVFHRSDNNELYSFKLSGHAESGPYGHDLVCSAVSALSISTVNSLIQLAGIEPSISQNEKDGGYLKVTILKDLDEVRKNKAQLLLEHLYLSMVSIQEEYNQYITVKTK